MSDKMSINVEVLGVNTTHNYLVPADMSVLKLTNLILQTLSEEYPRAALNKSENHFLIQAATGRILRQDCGLNQMDIVQGEKVILL